MNQSEARSHRRARPLVTFLQPYVPDYRVPFFDALAALLDAAGIDLVVAHGHPVGSQGARDDARTGRWARPLEQKHLRIFGRDLFWRRGAALARESDVVVQELASTNLATYVMGVDPRVRMMLWGHGKAYVTRASSLDARLEGWQIRHAEHVFVYTDSGRTYLQRRGVPAGKLTVVRNSTDTTTLRRAAASIGTADVAAFRAANGLGDGPVGLFVGALDESKLIPLLLEASVLVNAQIPTFRLIVAGAGTLAPMVDEWERRNSSIVHLPRTSGPWELALLGRVADVMLIPGRVGLVATDALALGLDVITTDYPYHAPERDYLQARATVTRRDPESFAAAVLAHVGRVGNERSRIPPDDIPSVEQMAAAFARVLVESVAGAYRTSQTETQTGSADGVATSAD
jgi:glycosyltransferase involved in cell wall biosynthesis